MMPLTGLSIAAKLWSFAGVLTVLGLLGWAIHTNIWNAGHAVGRQEAINEIAAQDAKAVAALRAAYVRYNECLARGGLWRWEQSTGQCVGR